MSDEIDTLFVSTNPLPTEVVTPGQRVVQKAEEEFQSYTPEEASRKEERATLEKEIKRLQMLIRKTPNVKNTRLVAVNAQRAAKRKEYTKQIEFLKLRLTEISVEEENCDDAKHLEPIKIKR